MAKDVRFNIGANPDQAVAAMKEMQAKGEDVSKYLGAAFYQLGIKSEASFEKQKQSAIASYEMIKSSGTATWKDLQNAHAAMTAKISALDKTNNFQESNKGAKSLTQNIGDLDSSVNRLTGRFSALLTGMAAYYVGGKIWQGFQSGIETVDDFQMSVVQMAATITSLQGGADIAGDYASAKIYAEGLNTTLMKVDANTSLNLTNLQTITFEMAKQGVLLDTNNAKQVESFIRLANAVAVYSNNGRNEMQVRQEISALMRGEVDQNSQLASMLQKTVDGPLQQQVDKWKQSGTLLEELGKRLGGFGEASKDISTMWSAVKSSFQTSMTVILQAGFPAIVKDISEWLGKINGYLKEHKDELAGDIKRGWETVKEYMSTAADIGKTIYNNFEPFAAFFIGGMLLKGIFGVISAVKTLGEVAAATRAVMLTTGMLTGGAGIAAAGTAAAGGAIAGSTAVGAGLGLLGAGAVGVGLGYAAQPLVRWADRKLYQGTGLNLTGEAMYDEAQGRDEEATKNLAAAMARKAARERKAGPAVPTINPQDTQEQTDEKIALQDKELAAYKAAQDQKASYAKASASLELADLKQFYAAGSITTQEYLEEETRIALSEAEARYDNSVAYYDKEVDLLDTILEKKGVKSKEYQSELAKNIKADEAVSLAALDLQKTKITEETKLQDAVRSTGQVYAKLLAQSQEEAGQYVQAAETKIEAEKKTAEFKRMNSEAQALKEQGFAKQRAEASNKELEELKQYAEAIKTQQTELDTLNGKTKTLTDAEKSLQEGRKTAVDLQGRLNIAVANGNATAISGLSQQISLQEQLNQKKAAQVEFEQQVGVLNGTIVGFSGNTPVYADAYQRELAANGYQSAAAAVAASNNSTSASSNFINNNAFPSSLNSPFLGGFDIGTNYIPSDGYAYLHQGEAVVPKKYNPAAGGSGGATSITLQGGISITIQGGSTSQQTAAEIAQQVYPELQKLARRQAA
ncbi:MAG: hypothetical protein PHH91_14515 [Desulfuromonadaceae bacterium]|nr:hypothetical protein [Desulfuromonadaceae bacterium]